MSKVRTLYDDLAYNKILTEIWELVDATTTGASMKANADDLIEMIDDAIEDISRERATLGAIQNRLDHTINNLESAAYYWNRTMGDEVYTAGVGRG